MNFPYTPKTLANPLESFGCSLDRAAEAIADGITGAVSDALSDPIVRAVMAADGVEPRTVRNLLVEMAARLRGRGNTPSCEHC
jgi:hypothetical protein